jgi:hypothetical protein
MGVMVMFLRQLKNKKTDRIYLSIVHGYRDKVSQKSRTKTIESLGYLDELEKQYDDPVAFFEEKAKQMNDQQAAEKFDVTFRIRSEERIQKDTTNRKNFGYAALRSITIWAFIPSSLTDSAILKKNMMPTAL